MSDLQPESDRFNRPTIETLAKRAANTCSNPDCRAPTSGPADDTSRFVNVGEAAHIYGARPGSARFRIDMTPAERSDITNGVWLCRNCHRQVDIDAVAFPADMLFMWRQTHEAETSARLGKANIEVRRKTLSRMPGFEEMPFLAQQIIIDKPEHWEYKLTTELLRAGLEPLLWRWKALRDKLYFTPGVRIERDDLIEWYRERMRALPRQVEAVAGLLNREYHVAWGEPGLPGSELAIARTSNLLVEACGRILQWEEEVRFANLPAEFEDCRQLLSGIGGRILETTFSVPERFGEILSSDRPGGTHTIALTFDLPPEWADDITRSFERAMKKLYGNAF